MTELNRREFVRAGVLAGVVAGSAGEQTLAQAPAVRRSSLRPIVIASGNGNRFKNGGDRTCVEEAFRLLASGSDPLDAVIAGVNIVEQDPEDTSVGFGGLPNADDAGMDVLSRIKSATIEARLLNSRREPNFNVTFYILNAQGEHAGVALYGGPTAVYGVCTENGAQHVPIEPLLLGGPTG